MKSKYFAIPLLIAFLMAVVFNLFLRNINSDVGSIKRIHEKSHKNNDILIDSLIAIIPEDSGIEVNLGNNDKTKNDKTKRDVDGTFGGTRINKDGFHSLMREFTLASLKYAEINEATDWGEKKKLLKSFTERQIWLVQRRNLTKIASLENYANIDRRNYRLQNISPEKIDFDLRKLNNKDFGTMYLFDLFGDSCSHGEKVLDVVRQVLNLYKLDSVISHVILRPVNYLSNINLADSLYYIYYKKYIDPDYKGGKKNLAIDTNNLNIDIDETPTNYLEAIYTEAIDSKPDIISSSYKGTCSNSYIEKSLSNANTSTNYLTAAFNDPPYDVDSLQLKYRDSGGTYSIIEPIASYKAGLIDRGSIIVGNQVDTNKYLGMYSSAGNSVTALGKGAKWGKPYCTNCIDSLEDVGTSFATPEVATKLLIAKAWWRKQNANCDALEARKRLILAANLSEPFIGKFASGGGISLNKLLQTSKAYLVKNDDSIIALDSVFSGIIMNGDRFTKISAGNDNNEISGLYVLGNRTVVLKNEKSPKWQVIPAPTEINIVVLTKENSRLMVLNKEIFYHDYKQFVILK